MKREEAIAKAYLKSLGFNDILFEPDGNIPPDFLINGKIAVEVRRLNQHFFAKNKVTGLEEQRIPLFNLINSTLKEFDSQYEGHSYWVSISFHRPIGKGNLNKKAITKALSNFLREPFLLPYDIKVTESIFFHLRSREASEGEVFRFAIGMDRESGGFVLYKFRTNFDYCVQEKSAKIKNYYDKYPSWWLVLVDTIAYGFDEEEKQEIKSMVSVDSMWDKVIVLEAMQGKNILEIKKNI